MRRRTAQLSLTNPQNYEEEYEETSSQDGGLGKHSSLSCITQQKLKLTYKTSITENHPKIELYGSLTTKGLKKSHSSRWVGGAEMQNRCPTDMCDGQKLGEIHQD